MSSIPDITEAEQWSIESTLKERWLNQEIELQLADGDGNYRCQFYYRSFQQYGTGKNEFDDITDCIVTMLQVHADKEAVEQQSQHG